MTSTPHWRRFVLPSWSQRKAALRRQAWVALALIYAAIAFASLWPTDLRNTSDEHVLLSWAAFMVWTLIDHFALLGLLIASVAALGRNRRLMLAAIPLALGVLPLCWTFIPRTAPTISSPPLRVMSVNLLMINQDTQGIIDEILADDADIVFLQEYTEHWGRAMKAAFAQRYPHHAGETSEDSFGAAIYSKRPLIGETDLHMQLGSWDMPQIRAMIEHDGHRITIINIHTLPPRTLEYTTEHRIMVADLADTLRKITGPYILAGDFNFVSTTSHAAAITQAGAIDAHDLAGFGPGLTWPVIGFARYLPVPGLRIDHIYLGGGLAATQCTTGYGRSSDHRPLKATLGFAVDSPH
jgi:endonuclease/exonuclease/phosphatase (EEP) superfamily protein YafD